MARTEDSERVHLRDIRLGAVIWQAVSKQARVVLSMDGTMVTYRDTATGEGKCLASSMVSWANHGLHKAK
jgi:hypothetical protein